MFFMFYIIVLINYVSKSENYVLKRIDVDSNSRNNRVQDARNVPLRCTSPKLLWSNVSNRQRPARNPNLKVNLIDKKLSDEMLSFKENIYGRDAVRSSAKTTTTYTPLATLRLKQWSMSERTEHDDSDDDRYDIEDLDFKHLLPESLNVKTTNTKHSLKDIKGKEKLNDTEKQQNHVKDKVVDLRSLSHHFRLPDINDMAQSGSEHNCNCSRHSSYSFVPEGIFSQKWNDYTGTTLSYPFMPMYLPYQPNFQYPPSFFMEYTQVPLSDVFDDDIESDDEDEDHTHSTKSKKKKKKNKCRVEQENVINIEYDLKPHPDHTKENNMVQEKKSKELLSDLLKGLSMGCKCQNCPTSLFLNCTSCVLSQEILLLLIVCGVINYML